MSRLTWKKGGIRVTCTGMVHTRTGVLRGLTDAEVEQFKRDFKGADALEEPITVLPWEAP